MTTVDDIREYIKQSDRNYVMSKHISREFGISRRSAGKKLSKLDGDVIEVWGDGGDNITWRVL